VGARSAPNGRNIYIYIGYMNKIESPRKTDGGNTHTPSVKQPPQRIGHFFTFNNYTQEDLAKVLEICNNRKLIRKFALQEETGNNGTPHLQGCLILHKAMRTTQFKLSDKIHWEKPKNIDDALKYCNKEDTRTGGFWSYGLPKPIKYLQKDKFYDWQKTVHDLIKVEPDERAIYWIFEGVGNCGKSAFVKNMVIEDKALFCNGGKANDLINLIYNTNMDDCNIIIWDLPRENRGKVSYSTVEAVKNGMICNTKYETGTKVFNPPHVVIFCNYPPEQTHDLSKDRWQIFEIKNKKLCPYIQDGPLYTDSDAD